LAAWLEAFAAVVALLISVWGNAAGGAAERKRDRVRPRGIAVAIYPELLKLRVGITDKQQALVRCQDAAKAGHSIRGSQLANARLDLPVMVELASSAST